MLTTTVNVKVDLPEDVSEEVRQDVQRRAEEGAILALWEAGEVSTREAAAALKLDYRGFLRLLAERGIPIERGEPNIAAIEDAARRLSGGPQ